MYSQMRILSTGVGTKSFNRHDVILSARRSEHGPGQGKDRHVASLVTRLNLKTRLKGESFDHNLVDDAKT